MIPENLIATLNDFNGTTGFLNLYILALITGSVLSVNRKLLLRSFGGYIPCILAAIAGSFLLAAVAGLLAGVGPLDAIVKYPGIFHRAIIMSAAVCIWMDKLEEILKEASYSHIKKLYLDTGTNEFGRMTTKEEFLAGAETVRRYFVKGGLGDDILKYTIYQDAIHSQREWRMRFPDALRWVFHEF